MDDNRSIAKVHEAISSKYEEASERMNKLTNRYKEIDAILSSDERFNLTYGKHEHLVNEKKMDRRNH